MSESLSGEELRRLIQRVFQPTSLDHGLAILVDLPDPGLSDNPLWQQRRSMASAWAEALNNEADALGLQEISLIWYRNVGSNNADLPAQGGLDPGRGALASADDLIDLEPVSLTEVLDRHSLVIALTELSATAPLKVASRTGNFRAATMPGFTVDMIPALRIDYTEVNRRVNLMKKLCDTATEARLRFETPVGEHSLLLDLRHRTAHASGGLFPDNGVAGNLPSGETYIVPYEGERGGDPSLSEGELPVQIGSEVVLYQIAGNRAVEVLSQGVASDAERKLIVAEPAYANLAELGLGVLGDFGVKPVGSILLDEKLGLHIAFGRSDHFGGVVGPKDFSAPEAVIHLDRVYLKESQPEVRVREVRLVGDTMDRLIIQDGDYAPGLFSES